VGITERNYTMAETLRSVSCGGVQQNELIVLGNRQRHARPYAQEHISARKNAKKSPLARHGGGGAAVKMGAELSLERFPDDPYGKSR
jgi:hypothetical protein